MEERHEIWASARQALDGDYEPGRRRPSYAGTGSFRVAHLDLDGLTPARVVPALELAYRRIREVAGSMR